MMDGCSTMAQWSSMYHHQQHGLETSGSMSLTLDPIHEHLNQEIMGPRISWIQANATRHQLCSSLPLSGLLANNNVQSQPNNGITSTSANSFDQQSLECCLFSGTNSNTDTSVEDDGISMIFSDCKNFSNFNSDPTSNNINNNNRNNNHPICPTDVRSDNNNSRKRSNIDAIQGDQQGHPTFTIRSRLPTLSSKKRQRNNTNNNGDKFRPAKIMGSSNISFQQGSSSGSSIEEPDSEAIQQMKEMIYQAAAFRPVNLGAEMVETPKRKNVRISSDPQTVAARRRRERISERLRVLQKIVPGGSKMDTASMLDEAANYLKFLRNQVKALEGLSNNKVDHYNYSPNHTTNLLFPPINLQFSSLPFPMQTTSASPFSL